MIAVLTGTGENPDWRLIGRTSSSADVLARIVADERTHDWQPTVRQLRDGDGELVVVATDDRHYRWRFVAPDGAVLAESPPVYRDELTCRNAFATAQRAACLV
jgi:hypothetical protein